ncbi:unnamed protein product [Cuscuta campestris]|uniref:Signal peptidase complex-like protein DTM1 n=2 Tax=Cuscuta sect. Cleistogrammica TaxID=1824901 RepID=A0A484LDH8_9ASTE|nr:hypothetical protein DM860_017070 [Cuscuta australis]VFQ74266.1 unnamed protein product [Cuscuta campestris]
MNPDAVLRLSLCWAAAAVLFTGIYTHFSFKKMAATYIFGMFAVGGLILPDWEFFDRSVSEWFSPVTSSSHESSTAKQAAPSRFRMYPARVALYTVVYGVAFYKWWVFVFSS